MKKLIKHIILDTQNNISVGFCFDSHFIIEILTENYSDEYLKFVCKYAGNPSDIARTAHSQIAKQIKELTKEADPIIVQRECLTVSYNIHHKATENTLWQRIK